MVMPPAAADHDAVPPTRDKSRSVLGVPVNAQLAQLGLAVVLLAALVVVALLDWLERS